MNKFVHIVILSVKQSCFILNIFFITLFSLQTNSQTLNYDLSDEDSIEDFIKGAKELTKLKIQYDPSYYRLEFPGGDVPYDKGACTDFVIRAFRKAGVDLQKEVFRHMALCGELYPFTKQKFFPDMNIDHRRVKNLMVYFKYKAKEIPLSKNPSDFIPGDIVVWKIKKNLHMGIVVDIKSKKNQSRYLIAHHSIKKGPKIQDILFSYKMVGHYRFFC